MEGALLSVEGITKTFPGVRALDDVSLEVRPGEIHALVGENGAGKSTLMNVVCGVFPPDSGRMRFLGAPYAPASPRDAQDLGIGLVHQEMALCPHLSISENVFLDRIPKRRLKLVDYRRAESLTARLLQDFNVDLDPRRAVRELSLASQQVVEIVKALSLNCRLLILDEPTSSLTEGETQSLFAIIRGLRQKGIGILYISHRLAEIFSLCDRISVLRDGRHVQTKNVSETSPEEIISLMVGRSIGDYFPDKAAARGREVLRVADLARRGAFAGVSFALNEGEILGFAGLVGAGRTEVARAVCGIDAYESGRVYLEGRPVRIASFRQAIAAGIGYVTEDRKAEGLFLNMSVARNISATVLRQITARLLIRPEREDELGRRFVTRLGIRTPSLAQRVMNLSGGNQQKVMLAKWLATNPRILFMDEPTRGIDVGAKVEIHNFMRQLSRQGVGIVLISSELPEIIGMCDRALVMSEGRVTGELAGPEITEENIMRLASIGSADVAQGQHQR